jgi:hypothetical protein
MNINTLRQVIVNRSDILEQFIKDLNEHTDEPTKVMLQKVTEHKIKFDKYKSNLILCTWISLITFIILFFYMKFFIIDPYSSSIERMFSVIVKDSTLFGLFCLLLIFSGTSSYLKKRKDKAEKEYHDLRIEIIQKSPLNWKYPFGWEERDNVFKTMKKEKDINLYHENK